MPPLASTQTASRVFCFSAFNLFASVPSFVPILAVRLYHLRHACLIFLNVNSTAKNYNTDEPKSGTLSKTIGEIFILLLNEPSETRPF